MKKDFVSVARKDPDKRPQKSLSKVLKKFLLIKDNLDGEEVNFSLIDDLLTSEDIDSELDKVAVSYALVMSLAAYAQERTEKLKNEIKQYEALLDEKARDGEITARVTDSKVRAWIDRDKNLKIMRNRLAEYKRQEKLFEGAMWAFDIKNKMLQAKSANARTVLRMQSENS